MSFVFLLISACSHYQPLEGNYFSKEQDCLSFHEKRSSIENFENGFFDDLSVKQNNRMLKFSYDTKATKGIFRLHTYKYYLKVLSRNEDSFMVSPATDLSRKFFNGRDSIVFKPKNAFVDKSIIFKKIIYHTNGCGWHCPYTSLELDNEGNIKYTFKGNPGPDSIQPKNYRGKLSAEEVDKLKKLMQYAQLRTIKWPENWPIADYPNITMIIYYNDQRLYLRGMGIPIAISELVRYVSRTCLHKSLSAVNENLEYEK